MLLSAKRIRSLLNGGAAEAGVKGLREAVTTLEAELQAHRVELDAIPGKRADVLLADDAEKELAALKNREDLLYASIEVSEARLSRVRARLNELTASERKVDLVDRRRKIVEAGEQLITAARGAQQAYRRYSELIEAAAAAGFRIDAAHFAQAPAILALHDPQHLEHFVRPFEQYRASDLNAAPLKPAPQPPGPAIAFQHHPIPATPHADFNGGVRLCEVPAQLAPTKPAAAPPAPERLKVKRPPRPALPETVPEGKVRCVVLKNEYPEAIALRATENNAVAPEKAEQ
jgi:hypothetical protein